MTRGCHNPALPPSGQQSGSAHPCTSLPTGPSGPCSPCKIKVGQLEAVTGTVPSFRCLLPGLCASPCASLHSPVGPGGLGVLAALASLADLARPLSPARPSAPAGRWEGARSIGGQHRVGMVTPPKPTARGTHPAPPSCTWGCGGAGSVLTTPAMPAGPGCPGLPGGPWGQREGCQLGGGGMGDAPTSQKETDGHHPAVPWGTSPTYNEPWGSLAALGSHGSGVTLRKAA